MDESNAITRRLSQGSPLHQGRGLQSDVGFRPGETLRGTVIGRLPAGKFMVVAKGRPFAATSKLSLIKGESRVFQVQSAGGRIELKLLDEELPRLQIASQRTGISSQITRNRMVATLAELSKARHFKGLAPGVSAALKNLNQLFPAIVYRAPGKGDSGWLLHNLLGGGLFWENKVARFLSRGKKVSWNKLAANDFKGNLSALSKQMRVEEDAHHSYAALRLKVEQCLDLIERDQFLNLSSVREGLGWFWFIPGSEEGAFRGAEVLVQSKQKGGGIRFSVQVDLSRLGELEAIVSMSDRRVEVRMLLQERETLQIVSQNVNLLAQGLKTAGLIPGSIRCELRAEASPGSVPGAGEGFESAAVDLMF